MYYTAENIIDKLYNDHPIITYLTGGFIAILSLALFEESVYQLGRLTGRSEMEVINARFEERANYANQSSMMN